MKRIAIAALCACLCLSMCACSSDMTHRGDRDNGVSDGVVSDGHASNGLIEDRTDREVTQKGDMARDDGGEFLSGDGMEDDSSDVGSQSRGVDTPDASGGMGSRLFGGADRDTGTNGSDSAANASGATGNMA